MDNVKYKPGGGDKKIFDDKDYLKQKSSISSLEHSLSGSQVSIFPKYYNFFNQIFLFNKIKTKISWMSNF